MNKKPAARSEVASDRRITLLDATVALTECAVLFALVRAADPTAELAIQAFVAVIFGLTLLVPTWWMAVEFANWSGRWSSGRRLAAHFISLGVTLAAVLACVLLLIGVLLILNATFLY